MQSDKSIERSTYDTPATRRLSGASMISRPASPSKRSSTSPKSQSALPMGQPANVGSATLAVPSAAASQQYGEREGDANGISLNDMSKPNTRGEDFRLNVDDDGMDEDKQALLSGTAKSKGQAVFNIAPSSAGGGHLIEQVAAHPALPVACYCCASILMTVVNKFVVSGTYFNMNFLLLIIQSIVCVSCVVIAKHFKLLTFRDFDINDARKWFPISFLLVAVIYTGSKSLQFLSVSVYTIWKNVTIILIAYGEVIWFGGTVTGLTLISFGLMILSSLLAAWSDVSAALSDMANQIGSTDSQAGVSRLGAINAGYLWMVMNCLCTATYVLSMRKRIKVTNFKDWDTMFYNNLLSIPVLFIATLAVEDWSQASLERNFPSEGRAFLLFAMMFSGAAAVGISYTTAWCVRTTSSTTYSMVGALNKLPVAASGMIFFSDPVTLGSVSAITVGFFAGLTYAVAKINQQKQQGGKS